MGEAAGSPRDAPGVVARPDEQAYELEFHDLAFLVPGRAAGRAPTRILKGVTGKCCPGKLTAIMGASGAGKTTLLSSLAAKQRGHGQLTGRLLINGQPYTERDYRYFGAYVMQSEPLLATATVKETIMTEALLRLPLSIKYSAKVALVSEIIEQLALTKCQDTMIGLEGKDSGISGGERKRTTVGAGLVMQPRVMLLDEPTSGLDSETAVDTVELLRTLARQGRTMVTTIHQPNSIITACFDDLLLLAGGSLVYLGPWPGAVPYFTSLGYACPVYMNPTDYFMAQMKDGDKAKTLARAWAKHGADVSAGGRQAAVTEAPRPLGAFPQPQAPFEPPPASPRGPASPRNGKHGPSQAAEAVKQALDEAAVLDGAAAASAPAEAPPKSPTETNGRKHAAVHAPEQGRNGAKHGGAQDPELGLKPKNGLAHGTERRHGWGRRGPRRKALGAPGWYQVRVLAVRNCRYYLRNPDLVAAKLFTYVFMGAFMGLMYLRLPLDTATAGYNRSAALWICMFAFTLMPSETACTVWYHEQAVVEKDIRTGAYPLSSYFWGKAVVGVPFETAVAIVFAAIVYFMIGFQADLLKFATFTLTLVLVNLISEMVGFIAAVLTRDVTVGLILISIIIYFCFALSGFIVQPIPWYFVWLNQLSYFSLAYTILVSNEWAGLGLQVPPELVGAPELAFIPPKPSNGYSIRVNLGFLVLIAVVIRLVAFLVMKGSLAPALPQPLRAALQRLRACCGFVFC